MHCGMTKMAALRAAFLRYESVMFWKQIHARTRNVADAYLDGIANPSGITSERN